MAIGIVGSGAMGSGIAQVVASAGHEVLIYDNSTEALERSRNSLLSNLNKLVSKGRLSDAEVKAIFGRVYFVEHLSDLSGAVLVVEAVIEKLEVKKEVFSKLEQTTAPKTILASNTSSYSITSIAAVCRHPERVVGIHFFNPPPLMKLVEVIPAVQTDAGTLATATELISSWGKLPVRAKDTPGFIVNRVARPFYSEALRLLDEGFADVPTIDWAMKTIGGFRMGPFELMDFIGNDVNYTVTESVYRAFYEEPRYRPSFTQKRLVEAGWLGRKSGRGFYDYAPGAEAPVAHRDEVLGRAIVNRVLAMLINEAADALFYGVASRDDLDLAMTKGVNYPKGLLRWADELGIQSTVDWLDKLYSEYREDRYRCSALLRKMARQNQTFYP